MYFKLIVLVGTIRCEVLPGSRLETNYWQVGVWLVLRKYLVCLQWMAGGHHTKGGRKAVYPYLRNVYLTTRG